MPHTTRYTHLQMAAGDVYIFEDFGSKAVPHAAIQLQKEKAAAEGRVSIEFAVAFADEDALGRSTSFQ